MGFGLGLVLVFPVGASANLLLGEGLLSLPEGVGLVLFEVTVRVFPLSLSEDLAALGLAAFAWTVVCYVDFYLYYRRCCDARAAYSVEKCGGVLCFLGQEIHALA